MLPKVTSVEQQTWLTSEFASDGDFWLSVIVMPNNPMKWFDGSELTFTNWAPDQPDHSKPGTVRIVSRHPDGRWVTKMVTDASSLTVCEKVV
ncbi:hypothetical protein HDE_00694 [Halotydeus destructor]|nr:hypothetical protein HDE_00694 [Halotydeus destructor]